jgi:stress-induced morphogen
MPQLLVTLVSPTTPVASCKSVPPTALWLPQDTPSSTVLLPLVQTPQLHALEVSYQPKSYSLLVPPSPEQPFLDANTTMLQESAFNAEVISQAFKTALPAHQTVLTALYHQVLLHALQLDAAADIHSSPTDHAPPLAETEPTDHQTDHVLLMERT